MNGKLRASLRVNGTPVEMKPFVEDFLARTVAAAVSTLKGAESIKALEVHLEEGRVRIVLNGKSLPLTPFPNDIMARMLIGMVLALELPGQPDTLEIKLEGQ